VTLVQDEGEPNNYVVYVVKQNDKNEETSNVSMEISQGNHDPDIKNEHDINVVEDPTLPKKQEIEVTLYSNKNLTMFIYILFLLKLLI